MKATQIYAILCLFAFSLLGCAKNDKSAEYIRSVELARTGLDMSMTTLRLKAQEYAATWAEEVERRGKDDIVWETTKEDAKENIRDLLALHTEQMTRLASPPLQLKGVHEKLVKQYGQLVAMSKLAEGPKNDLSLREYWTEIKKIERTYNELGTELDVSIPKINVAASG